MTVANLFAKHTAGEVSKEKFLYEVRKDSSLPWITNLTSYSDAIKILKNKNLISEAVVESKQSIDVNFSIETSRNFLTEQKDLHLQIDRLNPILVNKAVNSELEKLDKVDAEIYQDITKKVVKKLEKDPHAYDDVLVTNAKEINKSDEKLKMIPIKDGNFKDENRQMKKVKGVEEVKANVKSSKKENKKGKPKGVKEMAKTAKAQKGIAVMESLLEFMFKKKLNEDVHHTYARGQQVSTPDGDGIVDGIVADTISVKFDNDDIKDYQMNALEHYKELAKEKPAEPEVKKFEPEITEDKRDIVIKKIMELLKKKKTAKKEAITAKSTDTVHNADIVSKISKVQGQARTDLQKAFNSGKAIDL